jgi:hypothetical protein
MLVRTGPEQACPFTRQAARRNLTNGSNPLRQRHLRVIIKSARAVRGSLSPGWMGVYACSVRNHDWRTRSVSSTDPLRRFSTPTSRQPHAHADRNLEPGSFPSSVRECRRCGRLETRLNTRNKRAWHPSANVVGRTKSRRQAPRVRSAPDPPAGTWHGRQPCMCRFVGSLTLGIMPLPKACDEHRGPTTTPKRAGRVHMWIVYTCP